VERYRRSDDGSRLLLEITLQDPVALTAPVPLKKVWSWAPDEAIYPYDQCEPPAEFRRRDE